MAGRRLHGQERHHCNANIPTEEVFTTPHARRVNGHVVSTKPLSYQGSLIDGIAVRFEEGALSRQATRGEEVLNKVLDTDEGARRLAKSRWCRIPRRSRKAAVVLQHPVRRNAACHIALGQCYSKCFVDGAKLTPQQIAAKAATKA